MTISYQAVDGSYIGVGTFTTVDTTQQFPLGTIVRGKDATYGEGEFTYIKFTGTVAAGDVVCFNRAEKLGVQGASGAVTTGRGLLGVSMAAQVTGQYGWVMVRGVYELANVATGTTKNIPLYLSTTAGRLSATVVSTYGASGILGRTADAASNVGAVELMWPACTGNG